MKYCDSLTFWHINLEISSHVVLLNKPLAHGVPDSSKWYTGPFVLL